jgi:NDP-sugar pyrophosphorylase family protein
MANFALDVNTSEQELISSINYLLSTVGSGQTANALVANTTTGTITNVTSGNIIGYLYQWINVRYADTADGGTNFSSSPTNRLYYGIRNSTTSAASSNPADYIWFQVSAGGFATTKFLFYSSIGGNQIQFFVGTAAPNLFYEQAIDNTPIDLSIITTSIPTTTINIFYPEGQFIIRANSNTYTPPAIANVVTLVANVQAVRQNQITAAVDQDIQYFTANGNYFITSNTSTAFNSNLFTFGTPYSSTYNVYQDLTYSDITGTITSFISAALIVNDAAANVGPPGQRGSIPLGFVTTVNNPDTATTANLTAQFQAPRTNTTPPIGLGVGAPIVGDTVQFFFPNLSAINGGITSVRTWDGNVWTPVTANVISGNVIYTGTITSQAMSTFDVFTLRIQSTNSEIGNVNAKGFWLDSVSGDARFAGNTYVGNNLIIGNDAQIGSNLTIGQNLIVGNNASIGTNLTIGNNSVIGGNLTVQGLISQGSLANAVVTTASLQDGSITGIKIQTGTITGNLIEASTITGNLIAANTITGINIVSNSIFGNAIVANTFQANSINGNAIVANTLIVSGDIRSENATVGNTNSPGYWLQSSTGDARFGGNTFIGNNLTVGNLITSSTLNANVVTTNMLQVTSATQTIYAVDNRSGELVNYINGNATIGGSGYLWPLFTRGFAVGGGATISTTTNGSVTGSKITVNWNTFIANATGFGSGTLCAELWKTGSSEYYAKTFNQVRCFASNIATPGFDDWFQIVGDQGSAFFGNLANITQKIFTGNNLSSYNWYDVGGGYLGASTYTFGLDSQLGIAEWPSGITYRLGTTANINAAGSKLPFYNQYGVWQIGYPNGPLTVIPTVVVGEGGRIASIHGTATLYNNGLYQFENSNTLADLYDIYGDKNPSDYFDGGYGVPWNLAACGSGGTILYNTRIYNIAGNVASTTGWTQASTPTIQSLNSIASNYEETTTANLWVCVGDNGTILTSASNQGPWVLANSVPTTENLYGVSYAQGYWVAVGDRGTIIYSTNGDNWLGPIANPADGFTSNIAYRNLRSVAGGIGQGSFVVCGEEIIMASNTSNPANGFTANIYLGGSSVSSTLTRLQYYGSNANVANVSQSSSVIITNQVISGTYTDVEYDENEEITYYLVVGDMKQNARVIVSQPSITVTEYKR